MLLIGVIISFSQRGYRTHWSKKLIESATVVSELNGVAQRKTFESICTNSNFERLIKYVEQTVLFLRYTSGKLYLLEWRNIVKALIATLILLMSLIFEVNAAPTLLYHQDSKAQPISGSIKQLKNAIRAGKTIRLYMNLRVVEHSMDAGFTSIIGDHVYTQINGIQGQIPNRDEQTITLRPYSRHVGLYSTKSPYEMKWYAID